MKLTGFSIDFAQLANGGPLPKRHGHEHEDVSPALEIEGVPDGTVELALICHDPDAPLPQGWVHWTVYGLPATTEAIADGEVVGREGPTDFGKPGYGGPLPPVGHGVHHYYFWVYALSRPVQGEPDRVTFLAEYADAIIEQARCIGLYQR